MIPRPQAADSEFSHVLRGAVHQLDTRGKSCYLAAHYERVRIKSLSAIIGPRCNISIPERLESQKKKQKKEKKKKRRTKVKERERERRGKKDSLAGSEQVDPR